MDLAVVYVPIVDLPANVAPMSLRDASAELPIHAIGHPPGGEWTSWTGMVQNEFAVGGNGQFFSTGTDPSFTKGFSGAPILDSQGSFIGMHLASTNSFAKNLKSESIVGALRAWHVPTNNLVDPLHPNGEDVSALFRAIQIRDGQAVTRLVGSRVDVNALDDAGNTPLIEAIHNADDNSVKTLLTDPDIDVNKPSKTGRLPVVEAVQRNLPEIVHAFLARRDCQLSPLLANSPPQLLIPLLDDIAKSPSFHPIEAADLLHEVCTGASGVAGQQYFGWLVSQASPFTKFPDSLNCEYRMSTVPVLSALLHKFNFSDGAKKNVLEENASIDDPAKLQILLSSYTGTSPSFLSELAFHTIENGAYDNLRLIVKRGIEPRAGYGGGSTTLLLRLMQKGKTEPPPDIVHLLIAQGVDVNAADDDGETPLLSAVNRCFTSDVREILNARGLDKNDRTPSGPTRGWTALDYADTCHNSEMVNVLKHAGVKRGSN